MAGPKEEKKQPNWKDTPEIRGLKKLFESRMIYVLIAISFILFLVTKMTIFSVISILLVLLLLIGESLIGVSEHGAKKEIYEVGIAILTALVIWFGASFLLSTPAPLNAIVSCSMLPNLERGDLVILQGAEPKGVDVYVDNFDFTDISYEVEGVGEFKTNVSLALYCSYYTNQVPCKTYLASPEKVTEKYGPLEFKHGWCDVKAGDRQGKIQCVKSIVVNGTEYRYGDLAGDTIVYTTTSNDEFSRGSGGSREIIHRVFMKVHGAGGKVYYLTKGDNNDRFDLQYNNAPAVPQRTSGKVILRVPYLGYFKLFLFGFFEDPAGCDRVFLSR